MKTNMAISLLVSLLVAGSMVFADEKAKLTELQLLQAELIRSEARRVEAEKKSNGCEGSLVALRANMMETEFKKTLGAKDGDVFNWQTMQLDVKPAAVPSSK